MLSEISWSGYLMGMGLILILYYLAIAAVCYTRELAELLVRDGKAAVANRQEKDQLSDGEWMTEEANSLMNDIDSILKSAGKQAGKARLLRQLKARLANFDGLRAPAFRSALNKYLARNAREVCGVGFSVQELEEEWNNLLR